MRKLLFIAFILLICLLPLRRSFAFEKQGQDCIKCHTLSNNEAADLFKDILPGIKVIEIKLSPSKSLWEVFFDSGGKKGLAYIDFSKKYLILGSIISIKERKNLTQERFAEVNKVDVSKIPRDNALLMGEKNAKHKIIVFTDPDCPYCAKLHQELKKVIEERKNIAFYIKMFPLKSHPGAYEKSKAIVCENSLALLDDAFENKPLPKAKCETSIVDENIKLAKTLDISSTPSLVLPDGKIFSGYKDAKAIINMVGN